MTAAPILASDLQPGAGVVLAEVLAGLRCPQKELPSKYFYDERGSQLFEQICGLPEYYLTRTELAIMHDHAAEMAAVIGPRCRLVEYGSGSSLKTRYLLDHLDAPAAYVPIDIAREHLRHSADVIAAAYPGLAVRPVCADFCGEHPLAEAPPPAGRTVVYFPGSTVGNFTPEETLLLLGRIAAISGDDGGLLIGFDLAKSAAVLEPAYDDAEGVTAAFNLNILARLNRELGASFDLSAFRHRAFYNEAAGRIEMHLVSDASQVVQVGGEQIAFAPGETIRTEYSYKYTPAAFRQLASSAGLQVRRTWEDAELLFTVQWLTP